MFVMPSRTKPVRLNNRTAGFHSSLPHLTLVLPAGQSFSAAACMALTAADRSMLVLRRECGARIVRDFVLEGRQGSRSKWVGHWLIRLDALRGGIGWTTALILDGDPCRDAVPHVQILLDQGALLHRSPMFASNGVLP